MDYNNAKVLLGKIVEYDNFVGKIISKEGIYMYTEEDIVEGQEIKLNDLVIFRGEEIQNQKKAYFVKKINPERNLKNQIYMKIKNNKYNKDNN